MTTAIRYVCRFQCERCEHTFVLPRRSLLAAITWVNGPRLMSIAAHGWGYVPPFQNPIAIEVTAEADILRDLKIINNDQCLGLRTTL